MLARSVRLPPGATRRCYYRLRLIARSVISRHRCAAPRLIVSRHVPDLEEWELPMSPTRATVDPNRCDGNMVCERTAPEVFKVSDDDLAQVLVDDIPEDQREAVDRAVRLCPKQALALVED
jgi:ferredoxin